MPAKPQSVSIKTEHKPSGKWYWMEKRQQWGSFYYSFDSGDTWHKKRSDAFNAARDAGKLWEAKERNPMPSKKKPTRRKSTKSPSPAQLRARKAFALAAKARSKASKKKAGKKPVRRNKTIITKPKKVVVINPARYRVLDGDLIVSTGSSPSAVLSSARRKYAGTGASPRFTVQRFDQSSRKWATVSTSNPAAKSTRRKYRNGYLDLVIAGHATQVQQGGRTGWTVKGGGTKSRRKGAGFFPVGKGIVPVSRSGYFLDKATGTVFSKKARNVAQGFFDSNGVFHPIRSSSDYDAGTAGETGRKPIRTRSKKRKTALKKAGQTARLKAETRRRKSTTSRLASRSLSRSAGILKGSGSRRQNRAINPKAAAGVLIAAKERRIRAAEKLKTLREQLKREPVEGNRQGLRLEILLASERHKEAIGYEKAAKRNPSVKTIRKEFAGTLGKATDAFAPIGTPRNVAKLGKLLLIDTENATIKPTGIVYLCADSKGKLHLCGSKNVPIYSGAAQSFGRVKKLEYETAKPHLYPGQGTIQFWHKMGEESGNQPTLYADGKGGLKFRGGSYKITREGIVD